MKVGYNIFRILIIIKLMITNKLQGFKLYIDSKGEGKWQKNFEIYLNKTT